MTIACLGWGSLICHPRNLLITGEWKADGPNLPVEFRRRSDDGRLTLVVTEDSAPTRVLWCAMTPETIESCAESMRERECPKRPDWIGWWTKQRHSGHLQAEAIGAWAVHQGLKGVVWAALPPKWNHKNGIAPTQDEAVAYLRGLSGKQFTDARDYIRSAPRQVQTPWRVALESAVSGEDD